MGKEENGIFYIIVYPRRMRNILKVAEVQWFDVYDYDRASRVDFPDYEQAAEYAKDLAKANDLEFEPDKTQPAILD